MAYFHRSVNTSLSYRGYPNEVGYSLYTPVFFGLCAIAGAYLLANAYKDVKNE
jgi:hypothetical protein